MIITNKYKFCKMAATITIISPDLFEADGYSFVSAQCIEFDENIIKSRDIIQQRLLTCINEVKQYTQSSLLNLS